MPENPIQPNAGRLEVLRSNAEEIDIRLYTNTVVFDASTVAASFTEAVYPGYAPQKTTKWDRGEDVAFPGSVIRSATFTFVATGPLAGQIIKGWFATVTFPDGSIRLLAASILPVPVTMETAKAGLSLEVAIKAYEVN